MARRKMKDRPFVCSKPRAVSRRDLVKLRLHDDVPPIDATSRSRVNTATYANI